MKGFVEEFYESLEQAKEDHKEELARLTHKDKADILGLWIIRRLMHGNKEERKHLDNKLNHFGPAAALYLNLAVEPMTTPYEKQVQLCSHLIAYHRVFDAELPG